MKSNKKSLNAVEFKSFVRNIMMEGKNAAEELKEILPSSDSELIDYASKVDDLIEDFIKKAEELREEGSELVSKDILGSAKVAERNRFVIG